MFIERNQRSLIRCENGTPREFVTINCYKLTRRYAQRYRGERIRPGGSPAHGERRILAWMFEFRWFRVTHAWTRDRVSRRARFNIARKLSTRWKARRRVRRGLFFRSASNSEVDSRNKKGQAKPTFFHWIVARTGREGELQFGFMVETWRKREREERRPSSRGADGQPVCASPA